LKAIPWASIPLKRSSRSLSWKDSISIIGTSLAEHKPFVGIWTKRALNLYPPSAPSNASSPAIASPMAAQGIIPRTIFDNKYRMIFMRLRFI